MKTSQLISKTRKEHPSDETAKNAQLLIRAGFVHKDAAGVYVWLPLGRIVLGKIMDIIRQEMNLVGGQEVAMSTLQRKELWAATDRWDDTKVDVWFKSQYKNGSEVGLAWSHEEQMVDTFKQFISSYKDLPKTVYQFQNKMRNETRAKSGIMRTREFIMKDMYSFSRTEAEHNEFYDKVKIAYKKVFDRIGIGEKTFITFASGGAFAEFSHEFQTICEAGEDTIYISDKHKMAVNEEVMRDDVLKNLGLSRDELRKEKAAEVGNIFSFGTSKSEALNFAFTDESGQSKYVVLGSYGIGPARVMGVVAELMADDKGLVWPANIAPAQVHLISLKADSQAEKIYHELQSAGLEVLYDDSDKRAGEKFSDADLIGIPLRVVISEKTLATGSVELKLRSSDNAKMVKITELEDVLKKELQLA